MNSGPSYVTRVPASILRVAIATLSPGAGRRPTSSKARRSLPLIEDRPPIVPDRDASQPVYRSVTQGPALPVGVVACGPGSRGRGRPGGPLLETPVVDARHVLGPLARREVAALLEAHEPIFRIVGPDDEERGLLLADGELPLYLRFDALHRAQRNTFTFPASTTTS